jgi:uncharacterized alkaline shock family protein YloU
MSPVPDLPDADAISAAIATCPSVSGLSGGLAGEVATYLPGRRVSGVRSSPGSVEVHVVARYGRTLDEIDSEIRAAVAAAVPGVLHVDVVVADVEDPFAPIEEPEPPKELEAGPSTPGTPLPPVSAGPAPVPPTPTPPAPVPPVGIPPASVPPATVSPSPAPSTPFPAAPGP